MAVIEKPDMDAVCDVLAQLYNEAEGMSAEQALTMLTEAHKVKAALAAAISELETQALRGMEGPVLLGNVVWSKRRDVKLRPDQGKIGAKVAGMAAVDRDTGEMRSAFEAAQEAVDLMAGLYVSPSTMPKFGGLKAAGLKVDDVTSEEFAGYKLHQQEVKE